MIIESNKFGVVNAVFVWRTYLHVGGETHPHAYVSPNDKAVEYVEDTKKKYPDLPVSIQSSFPICIAWAMDNGRLMTLGNTAELWNEIKKELNPGNPSK